MASLSRACRKDLGAPHKEGNELAELTQGYAFAYRIIGKLCFEGGKTKADEAMLADMDDHLSENGYNVILKGMTWVEKHLRCASKAQRRRSI